LLVFVNVMGRWTGMIMPAPAGSTAAALGGGIDSSSQQAIDGTHRQDVNIRNNVNVSARSGSAAVTSNGQAGNATSGDAYAGASILNLVHSSFSLDDWFGALFINVIGSWLGDFDIAAAPVSNGQAVTGGAPATSAADGASGKAIRAVRVYQFSGDTGFNPASTEPAAITAPATKAAVGQVMGDSAAFSQVNAPEPLADTSFIPLLVAAAAALAVLTLGGLLFRRWSRN
jgi:hypothetical protein